MSELTREEKISLLKGWESNLRDVDCEIEALAQIIGDGIYDSSLGNAIYATTEAYTRCIADRLNDCHAPLNWYVHNNKFGKNEFEACRKGEIRKITNVEDLLWLIESTNAGDV